MKPAQGDSTRRGGVLVNELDTSFGQLVAAYLLDEGYEPCLVSPQDVVDRLAESPDRFDFLLTVVVLPEGDGLQLAKTCSEIKPDLKVLFASPRSRIDLLTNYNLLTPADRFIRKPFGRRALARKLSEVAAQAKILSV